MIIDFLRTAFKQDHERDAIVWRDEAFSYDWLLSRLDTWVNWIREQNISAGTVVAIEADFSPASIALFLALVERAAILVPLTSAMRDKKQEFIEIAMVEKVIAISADETVTIEDAQPRQGHDHYATMREQSHPGLVLFSSGTTGKSKAAVHDFAPLLNKFRVSRQAFRTLSFLLYDHIGGVNTMLYTLSNAGCIVTVQNRTPAVVLSAVAKHRVELLPTSPSFMNLILLSEDYNNHDLSSLKMVTYGTEPMAESTLRRFHRLFPQVKLLQTYGLSELGILRSKSKSSDSLWVKIGGEGFKTRIVDGILEIKAESAMVGYLNAPSPFTEDGWFVTGDEVQQDGEYLRILGRRSEVINVGGEKVYPVEVEGALQDLDNVAEISVYGDKNPILGRIVCADVRLRRPEDKATFVRRLRKFAKGRMKRFMIPIKVNLIDHSQVNERFKKVRPR